MCGGAVGGRVVGVGTTVHGSGARVPTTSQHPVCLLCMVFHMINLSGTYGNIMEHISLVQYCSGSSDPDPDHDPGSDPDPGPGPRRVHAR